MRTKIVSILSLFLILTSCTWLAGNKPVTSFKDYEKYLQPVSANKALGQIQKEIEFWSQRFENTPDDLIARSKIAGLLSKRFSYSGQIEELHQADSLYQLVNELNRNNSSATFRALAVNCITQHKFRQAQLYIDSALQLGDDKYLSLLMQFDIAMELGEPLRARKALGELADQNSFEYLIRQAKYKDHAEGDLDAAILLMEKAWEKIANGSNEEIKLWTKANLGDMYGHANRYQDSYKCYLEVLEKNPSYYHALKGIAWLCFSKDRNTRDAKKILEYLLQRHPIPDYELLLAEIAAYEGKEAEKKIHQQRFMKQVNNVMYGGMYNKYLFNLEADELSNEKQALELAAMEVRNRPTGEAFSWLAWAYLKNGQKEKALETIRYHVASKCYEPEALYYSGMIYIFNGEKQKGKEALMAALDASYELGPAMQQQIENALKAL